MRRGHVLTFRQHTHFNERVLSVIDRIWASEDRHVPDGYCREHSKDG